MSARPNFARKGDTNPLGKLTVTVGYLRLTEEVGPLVQAAAAKARLPVLEYLRRYIELGHVGRAEVERQTIMRLDVIESLLPKEIPTK